MLLALDVFFTVLHTAVALFNLCGWMSRRTRRLHLILVILTLASWLGGGAFYGWGYCFLTDWHFHILEQRGYKNLPHSYLTFLIDRLFGWRPDDNLTMALTGWVFAAIVLVALGLAIHRHKPSPNSVPPRLRP